MPIDFFQLKDYTARKSIRSVSGEELDNLMSLVDSSLARPLEVFYSSGIFTIESGEQNRLESDGADSVQVSHKRAIPPMSGNMLSPLLSTLNVLTGAISGDVNTVVAPSMTASYYVKMGVELRVDGKLHVIWGDQDATESGSTYPNFSRKDAVHLLWCQLKDDGTGGQWNFTQPQNGDVYVFDGLGGGGGGGGIDTFATVAEVEARENSTDNDIVFISENESFYRYSSTGFTSKLTDSKYYLADNQNSSARWVAISGKYKYLPVIDSPFKLYNSREDTSVLEIGPSHVLENDGTYRTLAPQDDDQVPQSIAQNSINFVTGDVGHALVKLDGGAFVLPTSTVGYYRRLVFVYDYTNGYVNSKFSDEKAAVGDLDEHGLLFSLLEGIPLGYIDLIAVTSNTYKSPSASTTSIKNVDVVNLGVRTYGHKPDVGFKLQAVVESGGAYYAKIKGGSQLVSVGGGVIEIASTVGGGTSLSDYKKDFTVSLTDAVATPVNNTAYYLYIDLRSLSVSGVTLVDVGMELYPVGSGNIVVRSEKPSEMGDTRYLYIGCVRYGAGSWSTSYALSAPVRRHAPQLAGNNSVEYTKELTTIGEVGSAGQIAAGHQYDANSFPLSSDTSWYNMEDVNDGNTTNGHALTNSGATFDETGILGDTNGAAGFDGATSHMYSEDTHFIGNGDHSWGLWFKTSSLATKQAIIGNWQDGTEDKRVWRVAINTDGTIEFKTDTAGNGTGEVVSTSVEKVVTGKWYYLHAVYNATSQVYELYLGNDIIIFHEVGGALYAGGSRLDIGILGSAAGGSQSEHFSGAIDGFFLSLAAFTDDQLSKVFATKIVHNRGLRALDQVWHCVVEADGQSNGYNSFVASLDLNILYADFYALDPTSKVGLKLQSTGTLSGTIPARGRDVYGTCSEIDALFPIDHLTGGIPVLSLLVKNGSGYYEQHDPASYVSVNETQIVQTTTFESVLGAATEVILRWATGGQAVAASLSYNSTYVVDSNRSIRDGDVIFANPTGQLQLTLQGSPEVGATVKIMDYDGTWSGTDYVEVFPSGSDTVMGSTSLVLDIANDSATLVYNGSDWRIL